MYGFGGNSWLIFLVLIILFCGCGNNNNCGINECCCKNSLD